MEKIEINTNFIKLSQFIKFIGIAENGAHAKNMIENSNIYVNNEIEKRKGKKLYKKDIIKIDNNEYIIY